VAKTIMNVEESYYTDVDSLIPMGTDDDDDASFHAYAIGLEKRESKIMRQMRARRRIEQLHEEDELRRLLAFPFTD